MVKKKYKVVRGFTLIELLAVIVILGIIMLVAIPAVTGYISGARNDSYINDAALFIDGIKNVAITKNRLPVANNQVYLFKVAGEGGLNLESGGKQSPYGVPWDEYYTYVAIAKYNNEYYYAFAANDEEGNFIPLSTLEFIREHDMKIQNAGSKKASRECIGGIASSTLRSDLDVNLVIKCTDDTPKGLWDTNINPATGEEEERGFLDLMPTSSSLESSGRFIFINGVGSGDGRQILYVTRVFTNNTSSSNDPGYKAP